jgi:hypothetical protein
MEFEQKLQSHRNEQADSIEQNWLKRVTDAQAEVEVLKKQARGDLSPHGRHTINTHLERPK